MKRVTVIFVSPLLLLGLLLGWICNPLTERRTLRNAWFQKAPAADAAGKAAMLPTPRQIAHAETEFYAFFHFGMNTYTDAELGTGREDPRLFGPTDLDTDQWVESIAAAGMKGAIITAKHHDGFCLWPSAYTEHSVKNSPYPGDVVGELAASCRKYGIKFGVYLSPFDENAPSFGQGEAYNDYFAAQLTELLTNYGEVFEVWFDGYISEEYRGRQVYDWDRWVSIVRELQPGAVTVIAPPTPDVAWVGNETGLAGDNVSSVRRGFWAKNECDVSIRNGWFYHDREAPKSLAALMYIYENSVGKNCALLLNIPPDRSGQLDGRDVRRLKEFGQAIRALTARPLAADYTVHGVPAAELAADDETSYSFAADEYALELTFDTPQKVRALLLSEDVVRYGERIERWSVYARIWGIDVRIATSASAGGKTLLRFSALLPKVSALRIVAEQARAAPVLRTVQAFG
ncbi:MAG: alpha-L-fucosidase [Oscillospiraceae bacterium]|jgi:alpha-L-fucosidase|nr:alpha-L-fucosidase [Oscillospiraceae bacterium]